MKNIRIVLTGILILNCFYNISFSQVEGDKKTDTLKTFTILKSDNINPGGVFLAPFIGMDFPVAKFKNNSTTSITGGIRIEYSSLKIYPFVIGVSYTYQKNPGADLYKTTNLLNSLDTKISSIGIGTDVILNKYLRSNFTIPFFEFEINYLQVKRTISPLVSNLDIKTDDNLIGISAGIGFTIYIFDILNTYNYAKEYSSASVRVRFRIPVFKL